MVATTDGENIVMVTSTSRGRRLDQGSRTRPNASAAGLLGLLARGLLYLLLAWLALELVLGRPNGDVDTRGALHELAQGGAGTVALVLLVIGFAGFALWHLFVAVRGDSGARSSADRLADVARAILYGALCAVSVSFLVAPAASGDSDRAGQTWTARLLEWSGGQILVAAVGAAVVGAGSWLIWRAFRGAPQDERAVLAAAPRETRTLHRLAAVGNAARGGVIALVGSFLVVAAVEYDPDEAVGVDGALRRLLDERYGEVLVLVVAAGLAAFGVYSIARAWVNRRNFAGS